MFGVFKKLGMTGLFKENNRLGVTLLELQDSYVSEIRTYNQGKSYEKKSAVIAAVKSNKKQTKQMENLYKKLDQDPRRIRKEFEIKDDVDIKQELSIDSFEEGASVDVQGIGRGKGFAGVMKRHNFSGQPASHGNTKTQRKAGSTGQCADPGRVIKGKKMPGRMGGKKVSVQSLKIVHIDKELKIIALHGSVPGPKGKCIYLKSAVRKS